MRTGPVSCATGCTTARQHHPDCPDQDECPGCLPRLADTGIRVCLECERDTHQALTELPQLWADLAERPRLGPTQGPAGTDTPEVLSEDRIRARAAIVSLLTGWCGTLTDTYQTVTPTVDTADAATTETARHHSDLATQARNLAALLTAPTAGAMTQDLDAARRAIGMAAHHAQLAEQAREQARTGQHHLQALATHLDRHVTRLLQHPDHAGPLVIAVTTTHRTARGLANPSRRAAKIATRCPCGATVPIPTDPDENMTCWTCGLSHPREWWTTHQSADVPAEMNIAQLAEWMRGQGITIVTQRTIRHHADRGTITPSRPAEVLADGRPACRWFEPFGVMQIVCAHLQKPRSEQGRPT